MNYFKILLGCIVVIICTFTGVKLAEKYKLRRLFYSEFIKFNRLFYDEVSFTKKTLPKIIDSFEKTNNFGRFINDYFNELTSEVSMNYKYLWFLSNDEQRELFNYFSTIGKTDANSQIELIKAFDDKLKNTFTRVETEERKYKTLYTKMGFLTGILILVLII